MTCIKFCGLTREADIAIAGELGVYAVGFVLWPGSPRAVDVVTAARLVAKLPPAIIPVGVFVRPGHAEIARAAEVAGIRVAQIHGTGELGDLASGAWHVWVAASLVGGALSPPIPASVTVLLDAPDDERHGGTGRTIDWDAAATIAARRRVILAGGLTPTNVAEAVRRVRPHGVDVSSGIEERPGIKSERAMREFVAAVRSSQHVGAEDGERDGSPGRMT